MKSKYGVEYGEKEYREMIRENQQEDGIKCRACKNKPSEEIILDVNGYLYCSEKCLAEDYGINPNYYEGQRFGILARSPLKDRSIKLKKLENERGSQ